MTRNIYLGRENVYKNELAKIKRESFDEESKDIILKWHKAKFAQNVSKLRIAKVSAQLRWIRNHSKSFTLVDKDTIEDLLANIN